MRCRCCNVLTDRTVIDNRGLDTGLCKVCFTVGELVIEDVYQEYPEYVQGAITEDVVRTNQSNESGD